MYLDNNGDDIPWMREILRRMPPMIKEQADKLKDVAPGGLEEWVRQRYYQQGTLGNRVDPRMYSLMSVLAPSNILSPVEQIKRREFLSRIGMAGDVPS